MERRKFLQVLGLGAVSLPAFFLKRDLVSLEAFAADLPFVKETDSQPAALKYCENADKSAKNAKASCHKERGKKERAAQYCYNCQLFQKAKGETKESEGKCLIMPQGRVHGGGWCMSWVQNPAVKG